MNEQKLNKENKEKTPKRESSAVLSHFNLKGARAPRF